MYKQTLKDIKPFDFKTKNIKTHTQTTQSRECTRRSLVEKWTERQSHDMEAAYFIHIHCRNLEWPHTPSKGYGPVYIYLHTPHLKLPRGYFHRSLLRSHLLNVYQQMLIEGLLLSEYKPETYFYYLSCTYKSSVHLNTRIFLYWGITHTTRNVTPSNCTLQYFPAHSQS